MVQLVKDPVLSLQQLGSLLWHKLHPWPGRFHMPWVWPKKKKEELINRAFGIRLFDQSILRFFNIESEQRKMSSLYV